MAIKIEGVWAYTIQGIMQAQSVDDGQEIAGSTPLVVDGGEFWNYYDEQFIYHSAPREVRNRPMLAGLLVSTPTGFYPFSEIGYMFFGPYPSTAVGHRGTVSGRYRVNTGGYPNMRFAQFVGAYSFDPEAEWLPDWGHIPLGLITTQTANPALWDHLWDYAFVMTTIDEMYISANARLPRPGVATGTMKRIQPSALLDVPPIDPW